MPCEDPDCTTCHDPEVAPLVATVLIELTRDLVDAEADHDFVRDTLAAVLDYVRWSDMPQSLQDDIDAIFDGNVEDDD